MNLQENISRIKQMMGIINERVSKKIIDFFGENGFFKGVFPHSIYETNEFVKVLFHDDDLAINVDDIGFFLQMENNDGDAPDAINISKKVKGMVVASDPELKNDINHFIDKEPTSWTVHVFLVKTIFPKEKIDRILDKYSNLQLSTNCPCNNSIVYCLTGDVSKEEVVNISNSVSQDFWAGLDNKTPESDKMT